MGAGTDAVESEPPPLGSWVERLGAAIAEPRRALTFAQTSDGEGRAPTDLMLLVVAAFVAGQVEDLARVGWLAIDGDWMGATRALLSELSVALKTPLAFVIIAGIAITALAGRRRQVAKDFDLACVAAVPIGVTMVALALARALGVDLGSAGGGWLLKAVQAGALVWASAIALLAVIVARGRAKGQPKAAGDAP